MAAILPTWQKWFDLPDGTSIGVHRVKLVSGRPGQGEASDTFGTRRPADSANANVSAAQVEKDQDPTVTVTQAVATGVVTVAGNKRDEVTIVTLHAGGGASSFGQQSVDTDNQSN